MGTFPPCSISSRVMGAQKGIVRGRGSIKAAAGNACSMGTCLQSRMLNKLSFPRALRHAQLEGGIAL